MIFLKDKDQIRSIDHACKIVRDTLFYIEEKIVPDITTLDLDVQKMIPALPTVEGLSLTDQMNNLLSMGAGTIDYTSQLASITKNFGPSLTAAGYSLDSIVSEATSALGGGLDICGSIPNMNLPKSVNIPTSAVTLSIIVASPPNIVPNLSPTSVNNVFTLSI